MHLQPFIDEFRDQLLSAAELSSTESRAVAERMTVTIDSAAHLMLLEVLSAAAQEITIDLAPGSVEVRLRGREPEFAVTAPAPVELATGGGASVPDTDDSATARVTLRLSEQLKQRIEDAAGRDALSVNAWLVRVIGQATPGSSRPTTPAATSGQSFTGWVR